MLERAEWRTRVDDPQTPLGWLVGVDRWQSVPAYGLVSATAFGTMVARALIERLLPAPWGEMTGLIGGALPTMAFVALLTPRNRSKESLAPDPAPGDVHSATVRIAHSDLRLGDDAGVLAFSDGWLLFEGARTSFAVCRNDVAQVYRIGDERQLDLKSGHRLNLGVVADVRAFCDELDGWMREPSATGLSRLPPVERDPRTRLRSVALAQLFGAGLLGGTIGVALTTLPGAANPILLAKLLLFGVAFTALFALLARYEARRAK